jgi:hypothetical protein
MVVRGHVTGDHWFMNGTYLNSLFEHGGVDGVVVRCIRNERSEIGQWNARNDQRALDR